MTKPFCPNLKLQVELPIQPPSCSHIKPDTFSRLTVLLTTPGFRQREWKFALYPNGCQHCSRKVSWNMSKNHKSDSSQVLDVFAWQGDKVSASAETKDKKLTRVQCHFALVGLWAGRLSTALPPKGQGDTSNTVSPPSTKGPTHSSHPEDIQNHLCPAWIGTSQ